MCLHILLGFDDASLTFNLFKGRSICLGLLLNEQLSISFFWEGGVTNVWYMKN